DDVFRCGDYRQPQCDAGRGAERVWRGPGAEHLPRAAERAPGGPGAAAMGGACDGDEAVAEPDTDCGYRENSGGLCAAWKPDRAGGCERRAAGYAAGWRAIRITRFRY